MQPHHERLRGVGDGLDVADDVHGDAVDGWEEDLEVGASDELGEHAAGLLKELLPQHALLELEALPAQQTLVNHTAPETSGQNDTTEAYSEDYDVIDHENVYYVLYRNAGNGHLYLGIGGPSLREQAGSLPPGDGSPNRDNGVRGDVAFKTVIPLSDADKQALIETFTPMTPAYNDTSGAYHYMHPEGL